MEATGKWYEAKTAQQKEENTKKAEAQRKPARRNRLGNALKIFAEDNAAYASIQKELKEMGKI